MDATSFEKGRYFYCAVKGDGNGAVRRKKAGARMRCALGVPSGTQRLDVVGLFTPCAHPIPSGSLSCVYSGKFYAESTFWSISLVGWTIKREGLLQRETCNLDSSTPFSTSINQARLLATGAPSTATMGSVNYRHHDNLQDGSGDSTQQWFSLWRKTRF